MDVFDKGDAQGLDGQEIPEEILREEGMMDEDVDMLIAEDGLQCLEAEPEEGTGRYPPGGDSPPGRGAYP